MFNAADADKAPLLVVCNIHHGSTDLWQSRPSNCYSGTSLDPSPETPTYTDNARFFIPNSLQQHLNLEPGRTGDLSRSSFNLSGSPPKPMFCQHSPFHSPKDGQCIQGSERPEDMYSILWRDHNPSSTYRHNRETKEEVEYAEYSVSAAGSYQVDATPAVLAASIPSRKTSFRDSCLSSRPAVTRYRLEVFWDGRSLGIDALRDQELEELCLWIPLTLLPFRSPSCLPCPSTIDYHPA
ncbi:hypothetical protein PM082_006179 [Marasmius tenuissimus]|nr:hypothetical protein PM082_006179 [Marasmius tenuissimus]